MGDRPLYYDGIMNNTHPRIAVIGAGPSGLAAAICAARAGARVSLFEVRERVGDTIKVTGDGRCNIANAHTQASVYRNGDFVQRAFDACPPSLSLGFLESCGLLLRTEAQGRMYPLANKATSVIDALRLAAARAGVEAITGVGAAAVRPRTDGHGGWTAQMRDGSSTSFDAVIVCCGGNAPEGLLPFDVASAPCTPVLGPLATDTAAIHGLDKIRVKCALECNGQRQVGEVTFRTYGISGIAAFDMSRIVQPGDALFVDFLPDVARSASLVYLQFRLERLEPCSWGQFCCGMLLPLVSRAVLASAGLRPDDAAKSEALPALDNALRAFLLVVSGIGDKRLCQVQRGGVDVRGVDALTLQLVNHPGLFVCGEALDVDGPCGGYNLHWAWTSGILAGCASAGIGVDGPCNVRSIASGECRA